MSWSTGPAAGCASLTTEGVDPVHWQVEHVGNGAVRPDHLQSADDGVLAESEVDLGRAPARVVGATGHDGPELLHLARKNPNTGPHGEPVHPGLLEANADPVLGPAAGAKQ